MARVVRKARWLKSLKLWSAITAIALAAALVLTFLPMQVSIDTDGLLSISLSPGQTQAQELSQSPIRLGFGWSQIDFSSQDTSFVAGDTYKFTLPSNINSGSGVSFSYANHTLTYYLSGGKMQWSAPGGTKNKAIGAVLPSTATTQSDNEHNKVAYPNAFLNTVVEYRAYSIGVKEVFVLSQLPYNDGKIADSYLEYTGELTWDSGLSVWADGIEYPDKTFTTNSSVDFKDITTNQTVFSFLAPIAWDSANSTCSAVYYVKVSAGKVQYGLRVPYSWLQTAVFPVTIDPSFTARTETYYDNSFLFTAPYDITVAKPTGTVNGDILFCLISCGAPTVDSVPSGWTLLGEYYNAGAYDRYYLYYKIASSEPASWTWSFSTSVTVRAVCSCYTGGDFDPADPIDVVSNTSYRTLGTAVRAASMTVSAANSPLVFWAAGVSGTSKTFTKPSVPTTGWVEDDDVGSTDSSRWLEICSMVWSGSGATGTMEATLSAQLEQKHAFAVALNPVSIVAPTVTTQAATNIYCTNFTGNGNITATGGANATTRGFCYMVGNSGDPTTANSTAYDTGSFGTGAYTKTIGSLTCNVTYRVRAYAINSAGTGYGTTVSVTTGSPGISSTPDNYGFGILALGTTVATSIGYFTLNNTGDCPVDITIQGTNLTGGDDTWELSDTATPDENIYGLKASTDTETLYENYSTGESMVRVIRTSWWGAQTFTPSTSHTIVGVSLLLRRSQGYPGTVTVSIKAVDGSNHPTGTDLCVGTTDGDTLPGGTDEEWRDITFNNVAVLTASTKYAIVVRALEGDRSNTLGWLYDGSDGSYSGGCYEDSTDSGSSWSSDNTSDFMFKEYGVVFGVIVKKTATYNTLVSGLAEGITQAWTLALNMPTSLSGYDGQQMAGTVTLVASAA